MKQQSIAQLKALFKAKAINETMVTELRQDNRKGVQQLLIQYDRDQRKQQQLNDKFKRMCHYEQSAQAKGCHYIAGVDEVGRGPLAGPVVAAAVILPKDIDLIGIDDSKKLTENDRLAFFEQIKKKAISYGIGMIDNQIIDEQNIFEATKFAMSEAIGQLDVSPDHVLVDAVSLEDLSCTQESIIKGDAKSVSIAAASVLAKVTRDKWMQQAHHDFPQYGFNTNMGYGTKLHMEMLEYYGVSPYHRKSFAPVRRLATS